MGYVYLAVEQYIHDASQASKIISCILKTIKFIWKLNCNPRLSVISFNKTRILLPEISQLEAGKTIQKWTLKLYQTLHMYLNSTINNNVMARKRICCQVALWRDTLSVLLWRSFWPNNILIQPQTTTLWPGNKCSTEDNAATMCSPIFFRGT